MTLLVKNQLTRSNLPFIVKFVNLDLLLITNLRISYLCHTSRFMSITYGQQKTGIRFYLIPLAINYLHIFGRMLKIKIFTSILLTALLITFTCLFH